jgi:hypothetical protein
MKTRHLRLLASLCLVLAAATPASAAVTVFDVAWSGASFSNSATATGQISIDTALLPNPSGVMFNSSFSPIVTGVSITILGATSGNGTFGLADFTGWIWDTSGATLDLGAELVGQGGWGQGFVGDFNLFGTGSPAPSGFAPFTLRTDGSVFGDQMLLTSFAPASVPEPSRMLLGALGVMGMVLRRRRSV